MIHIILADKPKTDTKALEDYIQPTDPINISSDYVAEYNHLCDVMEASIEDVFAVGTVSPDDEKLYRQLQQIFLQIRNRINVMNSPCRVFNLPSQVFNLPISSENS